MVHIKEELVAETHECILIVHFEMIVNSSSNDPIGNVF